MTFFVDTNILLHFVPLDQVDWNEVCGTSSVTILIAPIIIDELDKHKRNSNAKISKRAKTVVKRIGEIGLKGNLSPFVSFEVITKRPPIDLYQKYSLDKEEQDDRLLAAILDYKQTHDQTIKLISNDLGPNLKCLSLEIGTLSLPEKYELKEEEDDLTKENTRLKEQINKLKSGIPKLSLVFPDGKTFHTIKLNPFDFSAFKKEKMQEIEMENPYMPKPKEDKLAWAFRSPFLTEKSIDDYNSDLAKYYLEYESYLSECEQYFVERNLTAELKFKLVNEGVVPAENIDFKLHFPDGFLLKNHIPKNKADKPRPPFKPGEALTLNPMIFSSFSPPPQPNPISFVGRGFASIKKTNSYDVTFDLSVLKHNQDFVFKDVFLTFDNLDSALGFNIDYKLYAANIPDVLTGQLNVIVEKG